MGIHQPSANMVNVEIISKEIIKPSSPTPHHLRVLKLSFLDQIAPPVYVSMVLFYHTDSWNVDHHERSRQLKRSLSETLTHFHPLAGVIKDDFSIDCDDGGVEYSEARINCKLAEVIEKPNVKILNQFLPFEPYGSRTVSGREIVLAVQFNILDCGGVAIGVCISHKIADGTSTTAFLNAWGARSRGETESVHPTFDAASYFPPRDLLGFKQTEAIMKEKIVTGRFVFRKSAIVALKEAASTASDFHVKLPTRVEVVSAFIWSRFIAISKSKSVPAKVFVGLQAVNLRERMVPPLPKHSFGNLWRIALAPITSSEIERSGDYGALASHLRNAVGEVNSDYINKLQNGNEHVESLKKVLAEFSKGEIEMSNFSSWSRFPLYEVDFGWGKPTWVCSPHMPYKNVVVLMSTRDGDGIEAWVNMLEEDMAIFQCDPELLSLVSSTVVD